MLKQLVYLFNLVRYHFELIFCLLQFQLRVADHHIFHHLLLIRILEPNRVSVKVEFTTTECQCWILNQKV